MKKSVKLSMLAFIVAISCTVQEENSFSSLNSSGIRPEEAFAGRSGVLHKGKLYGTDIEYTTIDNYNVFEGDIILTEEQLASASHENQRTEGTGKSSLASRWPNNMVYYTIDPSLGNTARVYNAISHWEANTAVRFTQRTNQPNYIRFQNGGGCSSYVGMIGGVQTIQLGSGCSTGNTIHEIGHALGLWHEQSRADRNNYIRINYENIQAGTEHNFRTYLESGSDGFDHGTLDFGSIMMYPSHAFSKNGLPTIVKLDGSTFSTQRNGLSGGDIACVKQMYPGSGGGTGAVTVYKDCNYGGASVSFEVGSYTLSQMIAKGALNDWISSVKVSSGRSVIFYEHDNFGGATLTKTADDGCLVDDVWNDKASSMIVQ
jgi:hypothetical protein